MYGHTGHFEEFSIANIGSSIEKIQIPVNILPKIVQLCCLDQKTAFKMGINGHTRFDLYSSFRYGRTGHFEELSIANVGLSIDKIQIPVNKLPWTVQLCSLDQKKSFKMGINGHTRFDLYSSCTVVQDTLKNSP